MEILKQNGGAGRGQGRKPLIGDKPLVGVSIKMSAHQRDKLQDLGGAAWVREKIDEAIVPEFNFKSELRAAQEQLSWAYDTMRASDGASDQYELAVNAGREAGKRVDAIGKRWKASIKKQK